MEPEIIYQDDSLFVINKPPGWIVNSASTTTSQPVLQTWLNKLSYPLSGDNEYRSGIVHRLDKETSGVILVAKTKKAFENLQSQFKERIVQKTYVALAHGKIEPGKGEINAPVGRLPWRRDRFGVLPGGREAETYYKVIANYESQTTNEQFSLVELSPKTGRTHQIRIHLKHMGHSIVSDDFYAGRKTARNDRKWCPRLFLHAQKISFNHPDTNKRLEFESPLPSDLQEALQSSLHEPALLLN